MAYCRWTYDSDVYVFLNSNGFLRCCHDADHLNFMGNSFDTDDPTKMIVHLDEHKQMGHLVPEKVISSLIEDQKEIKKKISSLRKNLRRRIKQI